MKKRITFTVDKEIADHAKALAKSQDISLSELFSQTFGTMNEESLNIRLAAKRLLERLKNQAPIQALEKSDKELINEHRRKKFDTEL